MLAGLMSPCLNRAKKSSTGAVELRVGVFVTIDRLDSLSRVKDQEGEVNLMPLRYSRSKAGSEKYVKLLHVAI